MKKPKEINWDNVEFKNEKRFLSNMYPCEIYMDPGLATYYPMFGFDNYVYSSSENLYQALKLNIIYKREIIAEVGPRESKRMLYRKDYRLICRTDWDSVKIEAMKLSLELKFHQHADLLEKLLATGNEYLEERNDWNDKFWGTYNGVGENNLGKLLMELRSAYKEN